MIHIEPDLEWYNGVSHRKGVRPRCPFASVHRCPRFYQSVSLLGGAGSTRIPPKEDQRLLKKWKQSDLWPTTDEQATSIAGTPGRPSLYSNFCPEVAFERFGLFALGLYRYADEIDSDVAHTHLGREGVSGSDWRWAWAHVAPMHYTECPLYSPLDLSASSSGTSSAKEVPADNPFQAIFLAIRNWSPFWRGVTLTLAIIVAAAFAVWVSLPDRTKELLLDTFFNDVPHQVQSEGR